MATTLHAPRRPGKLRDELLNGRYLRREVGMGLDAMEVRVVCPRDGEVPVEPTPRYCGEKLTSGGMACRYECVRRENLLDERA